MLFDVLGVWFDATRECMSVERCRGSEQKRDGMHEKTRDGSHIDSPEFLGDIKS